MDRDTAVKCPKELITRKENALYCMLDSEFSLHSATPCLYSSMGYTQDKFQSEYQSMWRLCAQFPEDFVAVHKVLAQARETGLADVDVMIRVPLTGNGKVGWSV